MSYDLLFHTPPQWTGHVIEHMDDFLLDHAACERKASGMAMTLVSHYPDRTQLVTEMIDLAIEELTHFREVMKHIQARDLTMPPDQKDPYVNALRKQLRQGSDVYMLDQLVIGSIIEARGYERFALVGEALPPGALQKFYRAIAQSEKRHYLQFLRLAEVYFSTDEVYARVDELLPIEAEIVKALPIRAALH